MIALTESGKTALMMSRISSGKPIYALSRHQSTLSRTALYRGVTPLYFPSDTGAGPDVALHAVEMLKELGLLRINDVVIITQGDTYGVEGSTNTMRIITVY
ncbi:MAG: pyruvate kinase alpha/beta domain-containing protein, partial [Enterovibrio sp.]